MKNIIARCPICSGDLVISRLSCCSCTTKIDTELTFPAMMRLPPDLQAFVLLFLKCRGNIREVEKEMNLSYPTVCKKLDLVNELLGAQPGPGLTRGHILAKLERGEITAKEAAALLKGN